MSEHQWPTREEWAIQRRTYYGDTENPYRPSQRLSDYATSAEIADVTEALKRSYKHYGQQLRTAKAAVPAGLVFHAGIQDKDSNLLRAVEDAKDTRKRINRVLKQISRDEIFDPCLENGGMLPETAVIRGRYRAARDAANQKYENELAHTPVDDAAWEEELQWRKEIDTRWSGGQKARACRGQKPSAHSCRRG